MLKTVENQTSRITPIYEIKDDRFEIGHIASCYLLIEITKDRFRFAVFNTQLDMFMWLEDYQIITFLDENQLLETLKLIYNEHHFLAANYWKSIFLSINSEYFTLIPQELYKKDEAAKYLNFAAGTITTESHQLFDFLHPTLEAFNVYGIEKHLVNWFKEMYPVKKIVPIHLISVFIEGIMKEENPNGYHVYFEEGSVITIYFEKKKLHFCNRFNYRTSQDLAYHVLFVANQLNLKPSLPVYLYGEITSFSEAYSLISSSFDSIKFAELPSKLKFSYFFEEIPEHRYYGIFSTLFTNH